jgi:sarcosine oxidase delta subunit
MARKIKCPYCGHYHRTLKAFLRDAKMNTRPEDWERVRKGIIEKFGGE